MENPLPSKSSKRPENESQISHNKYIEIISALPRRDDWKNIYPLYQYQGFWYYSPHLEGIMAAQENFKAFELFCEGTSIYGPYWEHVLGYWRASLQCPERILFSKYEDMRNDTITYVKRLAEFMAYPLTLEEERQGVVQKIIDACCFENLRKLEVTKTGKQRPGTPFAVENSAFFRKGKIGDWKNHLTLEMGARIGLIIEQKLNGSGLTFISHQHD